MWKWNRAKLEFQHEVNIPYDAQIVTTIASSRTSPSLVVKLLPVLSNDDDQKGFISSLRFFLEKNKSIKALGRTLIEVLDMMKWIVHTTVTNLDLQAKAKELVKYFNEEFTTLIEISSI